MVFNVLWLVLQDSFFLILATVLGTCFIRSLNIFFKIHVLQLWLASIFEYLGQWAVINDGVLGIEGQHNLWLYNIYIPLEGLILLWASLVYFRNLSINKYFRLLPFMFLTTTFLELSIKGFFALANYTFVVIGICMIVIYLYMVYKSINSYYTTKKIQPEFWIGLGLVLYFALNAPFFAFFDFKSEGWLKVQDQLYDLTVGVSIVRYFLTALSLYMCFKIGKSQFNKSYGS